MFIFTWYTLLYSRNRCDIVNQLYANKIFFQNFSRGHIPFYIPTNKVRELQLLCILAATLYFGNFYFSHSNRCVVVISRISLMVNNVEHLFMGLIAIFAFSLVKYLLKSFTHFNISFFYFFNWNIIDLQHCISFWCMAKWFSYTYINIFFFIFFSIMVYYRTLNIVPCAIR